ncbi:ABC transporter permease subunit [bacterium]|nr:ABC transporter permease subunit [bacterium]
MRKLFRLNPITQRRIQRFRRIKRGYYSLIILLIAVFISLFSEMIANSRAIVISHEGKIAFPGMMHVLQNGKILPMYQFGQTDEWGFDDQGETDYRRLQQQWKEEGSDSWMIMPPVPWNPYESDFGYDAPPPNAPDSKHLLGTDSQGRDVFARLLYGFRVSIFFALALVACGQFVGTVIGCLQGYIGHWFDIFSQRIIEIWSTIPFLYVVIIMAAIFRPSFWSLILIMGIFQWITITFYMRTEMYREKTKEYCLAAKSYGASHARIIFKHLLPNCLTPLVTFTPFAIVGAIGALTGLDYLGYGLPPPTASWGEMIQQALRPENRDAIWLTLSPFFAIAFTLILVTLIGEAVREAFDPKQYAKYK